MLHALVLFATLCGLDTRIPQEWRTVEFEKHRLRVPASLEESREKRFFVHGGQVWQDEHSRVVLSFGHWAEESFAEEEGERCRVRIGDAQVFTIIGAKRVITWYDRGTGGHEAAVFVSSGSEERFRALAAIAFSLEITP